MEEKRKCPNCGVEMRQVKTKSHYDIPIILDQCEVCGGVWVEEQELYKIDYDAAPQTQELEDEICHNINKEVVIKKDLCCPTDNVSLVQPQRFSFPNDSGVEVEMCPICHSVWFNHDELTKFQKYRDKITHQKEEEKNKEDTETVKEVKKRLEAENSKTPEMIKQAGEFLSTQIRGTRVFTVSGSLVNVAREAITDVQMQQKEKNQREKEDLDNSNVLTENIIPTIKGLNNLPIDEQSNILKKIGRERKKERREKSEKDIILFLVLFTFYILLLKTLGKF